MQDVETKLKDAVKNLLSEGKVEVVVGYEVGSIPLRGRPCFVRTPEDADRLVWNRFCTNNLAVYLPRLFEKPPRAGDDYAPPNVGIVAKGCDARSIVSRYSSPNRPDSNAGGV